MTEAERFYSKLAPFGRRLLAAAALKSGERAIMITTLPNRRRWRVGHKSGPT